ncbi:hypothetical protein [Jannaschia aquimarina]|uniref:Uncharacterized protein n=1 Tax=Jannaschia aquimarina TaxID=935700 RepID=A0A0D1CHZ0_9RHOB|nr:hypothetical protein [Jannaschia aquimarina]KIT14287.1 hypothetical protein jaqu_40810 [Jannaschia aquimarina]SNS50062.1 hypothetical protein SAMN05421775_101200 [Jannaschia aquimarina]
MALISDVFLVLGALGLAYYCLQLSRRLKTLATSDGGLGQSVAVLGEQIEALQQNAARATAEAEAASDRLSRLIQDAEEREGELSVLIAGLGDLDEFIAPEPPEPETCFASRRNMEAGR